MVNSSTRKYLTVFEFRFGKRRNVPPVTFFENGFPKRRAVVKFSSEDDIGREKKFPVVDKTQNERKGGLIRCYSLWLSRAIGSSVEIASLKQTRSQPRLILSRK